jgi:hypothetical protein
LVQDPQKGWVTKKDDVSDKAHICLKCINGRGGSFLGESHDGALKPTNAIYRVRSLYPKPDTTRRQRIRINDEIRDGGKFGKNEGFIDQFGQLKMGLYSQNAPLLASRIIKPLQIKHFTT